MDYKMSFSLNPYPEYKNTYVPWIGKVPIHWKVKRGKYIFRFKKELNTQNNSTNVLSLTLRGVVKNDPENPEGLVPKDYSTYQLFNKGDLVFKLIDLENLRTSRVGLVHEDGIMSPAYIRLIPSENVIVKYFYYQFYDLYLRGIYNQIGNGVRSTLTPTELLNLQLLIPPITEQNKIISLLDYINSSIGNFIRSKRRQIELLNEQKQVAIQRALTHGLNLNAKVKGSGIQWLGNIPANWEVVKLKHVANVQTGITLGKTYNNLPLLERPYLRVANVQDGFLDLKIIKTIRVPMSEVQKSELQVGDILMTEGGDIDKLGRGYIWNGEIPDCLHQNHIFAVRTEKTKLLPEYLSFLLTSFHGRTYFQLTAKKTTNLASTNSTTLKNFPISLPPLAEQQQMVREISKLTSFQNKAISSLFDEINIINQYGICLISQVVTGKIDIQNIQIPKIDEELIEPISKLENDGEENNIDVEEGDDDTN
jgi:type I restriction enzyme S subunit